MDAEDFASVTGVATETVEKIERFVALLEKWQSKKNLVGKSTLPDVWHRHILDSAQLAPLVLDIPGKIVDIGSGAGFPGLILAIITGRNIILIESDTGKCAFLAEAARVTGAPVTIINRRMESVTDSKFSVVMARAVAPLVDLIGLAKPIMEPDGVCFFFKGQKVSDELTKALKRWKMIVTRIPSVTDKDATVLKLENIERKP